MHMFGDEVVKNRLGEALEAELAKSGIREKQKEISCILGRWYNNMTKEEMEIFDEAEEKILQYISFYGETAYRLGAMDDIKYGIEQKAEGKDIILSLEDMVHIIYIYDSVKKINDIILGKNEIYDGRKGILGALGRICDLAYNGTSYNIKLLGEDEADNTVFNILDKNEYSPEERTAMLLCKTAIWGCITDKTDKKYI